MQFLGYEDISAMLGVSRPLLMLDRLSVDSDGLHAEGVKCVSHDEVHFAGHFPGRAVMPGVLQLAAMVQASSALFLACGKCQGGCVPVAVSFRRVKFRRPVLPGMRLSVTCVQSAENGECGIEYMGKVTAGGQVVSSGIIGIASKPMSWYSPSGAPDSELPSEVAEGRSVEMGVMESLLPHRYPFLFLDGIESLEDPLSLNGIKAVTGNGAYTSASRPVHYPNLLQIESAAQLGCAAALSRPEYAGCKGFFMSIDSAVCHGPGLPGEMLDVRLSCEIFGHCGVAEGRVSAGGRLLTELAIKFALVGGKAQAGAESDLGAEMPIT